jgi:hypothetical protein
MPPKLTIRRAFLLSLSLALSSLGAGCRSRYWDRPVIWLNHPTGPALEAAEQFAVAFSIAEPCEGISLQEWGIPKSRRWSAIAPPAEAPPVQWTIAHAEDSSATVHGAAPTIEVGVLAVCAYVKQQGQI